METDAKTHSQTLGRVQGIQPKREEECRSQRHQRHHGLTISVTTPPRPTAGSGVDPPQHLPHLGPDGAGPVE